MHTALKRAGAALLGALLASAVVSLPASAEPAAISGTMTSATTGQPLEGCVDIYTAVDSIWAGSTCTDGSGSGQWETSLEAGTAYRLRASPYGETHLDEWAHDVSSFEQATAITAPARVDFVLDPGAILAGTLTVADGDPLSETPWVTVSSLDGDHETTTWASEGSWQVLVPAGTYSVDFRVGPTRQWAFGKATPEEADPIVAVAGQTTRVDDVLPAVDETTFSGTVTAADSGEFLDACVSAYVATTMEWAGSACTGTEGPGQWTITTLAAGIEYKFEVSTWDGVHLGEWADDADSIDTARTYTGPATIDVALEKGAVLSGVMVGADGQPAADVSVGILPVDDTGPYYWAHTWDEGRWQALVRPGSYVVQFQTNDGGSQYAFGARSREDANVFTVAAGETVDASDTFLPAASVSGTIVSDVDGAPIEGICVNIIEYPVLDGPWAIAESCTDSEGRYTARLPRDGTFIAEFVDQADDGRFVSEYYDDAETLAEATPITVVNGLPATVNASLSPAATISGVAVDAKLGTPLAGVCPRAYLGHDGDQVRHSMQCSGADGRWTVGGLRSGAYALQFTLGNGPMPATSVWAFKADTQASADLVSVGVGEAKEIRDVKVPSPATLTGRITDSAGNPVEGAIVNPRGDLPDRSGECFDCATTDADGRYSIPVLEPGTYRPVAHAPWDRPLAPAWSGGATSYEAATPITINSGKTGTFSVELAPASRLTGSVIDAGGQPVTEGWIGEVLSESGRHIADFDVFGSADFMVPNLPAGALHIRLENHLTGETVWYDQATDSSAATVIVLGVGETKEITFRLP